MSSLRITPIRGLALLASIVLTACGSSNKLQEPPKGAVLFDVFSINYAWGFDCGGCYVDSEGNVHRYNCNALRDTIRSEEWRGREQELLKRRFHMKDSIVCRIESDNLATMRALALKAAQTSPTEEQHTAYDAGATQFTAYMYSSAAAETTEVQLATVGDFSSEPSSTASDSLVRLLRRACSCRDSAGVR